MKFGVLEIVRILSEGRATFEETDRQLQVLRGEAPGERTQASVLLLMDGIL